MVYELGIINEHSDKDFAEGSDSRKKRPFIYKAHCISNKCCSIVGAEPRYRKKVFKLALIKPEYTKKCPDCSQEMHWTKVRS